MGISKLGAACLVHVMLLLAMYITVQSSCSRHHCDGYAQCMCRTSRLGSNSCQQRHRPGLLRNNRCMPCSDSCPQQRPSVLTASRCDPAPSSHHPSWYDVWYQAGLTLVAQKDKAAQSCLQLGMPYMEAGSGILTMHWHGSFRTRRRYSSRWQC